MLRKIIGKMFQISFLITRPLTMGVRVILRDGDQILLVRHTYVPGWHLPGGGVDPGETIYHAAARELREECAIAPRSALILQSIHFQKRVNNRDHVALLLADGSASDLKFQSSREIAEAAFFPWDELPEGTTQSTKKRLSECFEKTPMDEHW